MFGAICGDVIGSVYEWVRTKEVDFPLFSEKTDFTDDTVLTVATAEAVMTGRPYAEVYQEYARNHPNRGYGGRFRIWIKLADPKPYDSFGNGSAMRVSPVGWAYKSLRETEMAALESAWVTHNHPEGVKGAIATALAMYSARQGVTKEEIREYIGNVTGYNLKRTVDEIRPSYTFNETCQETVPQAIIAFLDSTDYENAIRLAISLGGDSDTLACITGGIAEAFYGPDSIPADIRTRVRELLPAEFLEVIDEFYDFANINAGIEK